MPYCPKCDMEFVEGVTICSDCKGPLVASKEFAMQMKEELKRQERETLIQTYRQNHPELPADFIIPEDIPLQEERDIARLVALLTPEYQKMHGIAPTSSASEEEYEEDPADSLKAELEQSGSIAQMTSPTRAPHSTPYVKQADKYEDLKSSAAAFWGVGGILLVFSILAWLQIIPIPVAGTARYLFLGVLTAMGVFSIIIALSTQKSARQAQASIASEEKNTKEIIDWFLQTFSAEEIEKRITLEYGDLSPEERSLKRFELIQDYLITGKDIPDESYVDELSEEIYSRLFE
ncbi:MAG: hypothetical protein Q4E24_15385 [bacterium]|nr:hypothetical protein [bacterium]